MRSSQDIISKIHSHKDDFFGFIASDLIQFLDYEDAKQFLKPEVKAEEWKKLDKDDAAITTMIVDYLPFAWKKANNCRGLSAGRSIEHFRAWFWMLGKDEFSEEIQNYEYYGKPQLAIISEYLGFNWKEADDGKWVKDEGGAAVDISKAREKFSYLEKLLQEQPQ